MTQYEATLTIKWYPELKHKTPEAELGAVVAHNLFLLRDEGMVVVSENIKPLPSSGNSNRRKK
jgi:hypothetical protein